MAEYDINTGYSYRDQNNLSWAQAFQISLRMPAIANRVFDTKQHAIDFINNVEKGASAVEGLLLTVFKDETLGNNGIYFVKSIKEKITTDENGEPLKDESGNTYSYLTADGELLQIYDSDNNKAVGCPSSDELQVINNDILQLKKSVGLEDDFTLPDDFNYESIIDSIQDLKANTNFTAGTNVEITEDNVINVDDMRYDDSQIRDSISSKQDKLTAGTNIKISGNTISADSSLFKTIATAGTGNAITSLTSNSSGTLTANKAYLLSGITVSGEGNAITTASASNGTLMLTKGYLLSDVTVSGYGNTITSIESDGKGVLTAKKGNSLKFVTVSGEGNAITTALVNDGVLNLGKSTTFLTKTDLNTKQDVLAAGDNIIISGNTISTDKKLLKTVTTSGNGNAIITIDSDEEGKLTGYKRYLLSGITYSGKGNAVFGISTDGQGSLIVNIGSALTHVNSAGTGNAITKIETKGFAIEATLGYLLSGITVTGQGNVITNITSDGKGALTASKAYRLSGVTVSGAGNAITTASVSNGELTLGKGTTFATEAQLSGKQDKLTAGTNISINGNTISTNSSLLKSIVTSGTGNAITALTSNGSGTLTVSKGYLLSGITVSGSGNAITTAAASNGQLTLGKGTTFATKAQLDTLQASLDTLQTSINQIIQRLDDNDELGPILG